MGEQNNTRQEILERMHKTGVVRIEERVEKAQNLPAKVEPIRSVMINPYSRFFHHHKNILESQKRITFRTLRRVAEKAWLINTIINHQMNRIRPFLKPAPDDKTRGYKVCLKDDEAKPNSQDKKMIRYLEEFIFNTGEKDGGREDNLVLFTSKLVRDVLSIDQVSTELQRTRGGNLYAFWAVDPATIYRVTEEGYEDDDRIRFVQEVEMIVTAKYTAQDLVFDYMNPRSDIEYAGYGYSNTEQAIELITSLINTFTFNSSAFTEDFLPRGMLLLSGDADVEDVEAIEDYIISVMSGGPMAKWKIPIVPSGKGGTGKEGDRKFDWISFNKSNQEMQFSQWTEFLWTSTAALYGTDLEELGIRTQKSTSLLGENVEPKIRESKSRTTATLLSFLESHLGKIIDFIDPKFRVKFIGYEKEDIKLKNQATESELRTWKSVDMICKENDAPTYNQPWSKIPLNPYVVQLMQASMGMQGMGGQPPAGGFREEPAGEETEKEWEEPSREEQEEKEAQKVKKSINKVIEIIV